MASPVDVLNKAFTEAGAGASLGEDSSGVCSLGGIDISSLSKQQQVEHIWKLVEQNKSAQTIADEVGWTYTKTQKLILILKKQKGVINEALTKQQVLEAKAWKLISADTPVPAPKFIPVKKGTGGLTPDLKEMLDEVHLSAAEKKQYLAYVKGLKPGEVPLDVMEFFEAGGLPKPPVFPKTPPKVLPTIGEKPPEWFDDLLKNKTSSAIGSNAGGVYNIGDEKYYVKFYSDAAQAHGEHLSNSIYRDVGLHTPQSVVGKTSTGQVVYASRWIDELEGTAQSLGFTEKTAEKFLDGFVADVFTANWDATGTFLDNFGILKSGNVVRLDQGGSLLFRAKAGKKPDAALNKIDEWFKFFDGSNPYYKQVTNKAGYEIAEALGSKRLVEQIDAITSLVGDPRSSSQWALYIRKYLPPDVPSVEVQRISEMLSARASLLLEKRKMLANNLLPVEKFVKPKRPFTIEDLKEAPLENWPIGPNVVRTIGQRYPKKVETTFEQWARSLSPEQKRALESYTGSSYSEMNRMLRQGEKLTGRAAQIQSALKVAPKPPPPELVWRGIGSEGVADFLKKIATGDVISLEGFQSTSINPGFAASWGSEQGLFEIRPKSGAYIRTISQHKSEYEFLLPHGARYQVRGIRKIQMQGSYGMITRTVVQLDMID